MPEMQAAIGRIQLVRMPQWHEARRRNAMRLAEAFRSMPALRVPDVPADVEHAWYKFYAFVRPEALAQGWSRDRVMNAVTAAWCGPCPPCSWASS